MSLRVRQVVLGCVFAIVTGCGSDGAGGKGGAGGTGGGTGTGGAAPYARVQALINSYACATLCHYGPPDGQFPDLSTDPIAAMKDVDSEQCAAMGGRKLVVPGSPETSYLMDKLRGTNLCFGMQMPGTGRKLTDEELSTVSSWIAGGALPP